MATMRSATLVAPYQIKLEEIEKPEVDDDSVIIEIAGLGICGSNLHWWYGGGPATAVMTFPMPGAGGHEFSGVVAEVGKNVTRVKPGDRVTVDQFESGSCGSCSYCASGIFSHCDRPQMRSLQGFVEYLKTSERGLYHLPDNVETHAAAVVQPYACSVSGVRRAEIKGGEKVVVLGAGVLGLCAAATAKALGAEAVVITAKYDSQAALAPRFGADVVVPSGADDADEQIRAAIGGRGADLVVETVGGHAPTLAQALDLVRPSAKIVVLGLWDDLVPVDSWKSILADVTMLFCLNHQVIGKYSDYQLCVDWMANGTVPAQDLVTHVLPLDQIEEAFRLAADKQSGAVKVIVKP